MSRLIMTKKQISVFINDFLEKEDFHFSGLYKELQIENISQNDCGLILVIHPTSKTDQMGKWKILKFQVK